MVTHSSILAWRIPWTEKPGATVHGVTKSRTRLSYFIHVSVEAVHLEAGSPYSYLTFAQSLLNHAEKEMATHSSTLA